MFTTLPKCKAWTKNTMAMLGVSWSQIIYDFCLGLALGRLVARVIYGVYKMIVKTLCILPLTMKHYVVVLIFQPYRWKMLGSLLRKLEG